MNKLPVGRTIGFAYSFAFGQLGTIIGLVWLPLVLIAVLGFLPYALGDTLLVRDQDPTAFGEAQLRALFFGLGSIMLYAIMYVAVTRQALGLRKGSAVFHFALGRDEFRMFVALFLLGAILFTMLVILAALSVAVSAAAAAAGGMAAVAVATGIVMFAGTCVIIVAATRLGFLLPPINVVEGKFGFERGWALTKGNFWRISAVLFAVTFPVVLVMFTAQLMLMGHDLSALAAVAGKMTPEEVMNRLQVIQDRHIAPLSGVFLILAPFTLGLLLGASVAGYRALTAGPSAPQS